MRNVLLCIILLFINALIFPSNISSRLQQKLITEQNSYFDVIILFKSKTIEKNGDIASKIKMLQNNSSETQEIFNFYIKNNQLENEIFEKEFFWIANIAKIKCTAKFIEKIKYLEIIEYIDIDAELSLDNATNLEIVENITTVQPGLKIVNAHKLWQLGITGKGIIVMNIDTGVDGNHPALKDKWLGLSTNPKQAWFDPKWNTSFPVDSSKSATGFGHGTHTMGTICGRAGNDTIGVAFDAWWIASNSISGGNPHTSRTIAALQWAANPDSNIYTISDMPAVINCSWYDASAEPCNNIYKTLFENLENLNIAVFFSAGNSGPAVSSISTPQTTVINKVNPFTVGNLDGSKYLAGNTNPIFNMSSRGPTTCSSDPVLSIKPEVVAPGTDIISCIPGNNYAKMTGTSMASPHVAGIYALLKQAFPYKTAYEIKEAIYETAKDLGTPGKDNTYGKGLADAYAAALYLDNKVPPTKVNDLSIVIVKSNSAILKWTTPFDSSYGGIYEYDFRISTKPIDGNNFGFANKILSNKPKKAGIVDTIIIHNLNPNTTYYVALKSSDIWSNTSEISNVISFTTLGIPKITLSKKEINRNINFPFTNIQPDTLTIYNISSNTSYLEGNLSFINAKSSLYNTIKPKENLSSNDSYVFNKKSEAQDIDMPSYNVNNFTLPSWQQISSNYPINDEAFAVIDFNGKSFKFYNNFYKKAFLSTNGFLTFDTITSIANRQNTNIPNTAIPNNLIAFFWDNLKLLDQSQTKIYYFDNYILIEGKDWALSADPSNNQLLSFKLLLNFYQNSITCLYEKIPQNTTSITIGIENANGTDGMQVVYNSTSFTLPANEIYKWSLYPKFIKIKPTIFSIPNKQNQIVTIEPNYDYLYPGEFWGKILIQSNDVNLPTDTISIHYKVVSTTKNEKLDNYSFELYPNYPNPFNPSTVIYYSLPKTSYIELKIYNINGSLVKTLYNGIQTNGLHYVQWDGRNELNQPVSSGIYIYVLKNENMIKTKKMLLLK